MAAALLPVAGETVGGVVDKVATAIEEDPIGALATAFRWLGLALVGGGILAALGGYYATQQAQAAATDEASILQQDAYAFAGKSPPATPAFIPVYIGIPTFDGAYDLSALPPYIHVNLIDAAGTVVDGGPSTYNPLPNPYLYMFQPKGLIKGQTYTIQVIWDVAFPPIGKKTTPTVQYTWTDTQARSFDFSQGESPTEVWMVSSPGYTQGQNATWVLSTDPSVIKVNFEVNVTVLNGWATGLIAALTNLAPGLFVSLTTLPHLLFDALTNIVGGATGAFLTGIAPWCVAIGAALLAGSWMLVNVYPAVRDRLQLHTAAFVNKYVSKPLDRYLEVREKVREVAVANVEAQVVAAVGAGETPAQALAATEPSPPPSPPVVVNVLPSPPAPISVKVVDGSLDPGQASDYDRAREAMKAARRAQDMGVAASVETPPSLPEVQMEAEPVPEEKEAPDWSVGVPRPMTNEERAAILAELPA